MKFLSIKPDYRPVVGSSEVIADFMAAVRADPNKPILVNSVSGGETSVLMGAYVQQNYADQYHILNVFMNTGEEREETLQFMHKADKFFGMRTVWIESVTQLKYRIGKQEKKIFTVDEFEDYLFEHKITRSEFEQHPSIKKINIGQAFKIVNYKTASRDGKPFRDLIYKRGIPNIKRPHCTRDLKTMTFKAFMRVLMKGLGRKSDDYYTAIGIRSDEIDRVSAQRVQNKLIYPFIEFVEVTKPMVNTVWRDLSFRLELQSWEGNCRVCFKKALRKLLTIAKRRPSDFDNIRQWEKMDPNYRFYRGSLSVDQIFELAQQPFEEATDDKIIYTDQQLQGHDLDTSLGCDESCNAF